MMPPSVCGGERLAEPLGLVVHGPGAYRVDISPVVLRLRMHEWVSVHLRGRREDESCLLRDGEIERVHRAYAADLHRLHRAAEVVRRRRRRREMEDPVHLTVDLQRGRDVDVRHAEPHVVEKVLDVGQPPGHEVVDAHHCVATADQPLAYPRPEKARATGHDDAHPHPVRKVRKVRQIVHNRAVPRIRPVMPRAPRA